ncbi:MAG: metallophosphoesterase [Candidatus Thorarchaeota archaeon]
MEFLVLTDIHDTWTHLRKMLRLADEMDGVIFLGDLMTFRKLTKDSKENLARIREASRWMVGLPGNGALPAVREFLNELGINLHCQGRIIDGVGFFGIGGVQETIGTILEIREFFRNEDTSGITPDEQALVTLNVFGIHRENDTFVVSDWSESDIAALEVYVSPFEHSEARISEMISSTYAHVEKASVQILLSHTPPYEPGVIAAFPLGVSTGSKAIAAFIEKNPIAFALSGHNHIHHEFLIGNTKCVIVPAVTDGFYGVLSVEPSTKNIRIKVNNF